MHLIVTRPAADAAEMSRQLQALGHRISVAPMLEVRFTGEPIRLDGVQAIIATSRNALRALAASPHREAAIALPIYVVGPGSAELAREIGFSHVTAGTGGAKDLLPRIVEAAERGERPLLYLSGAEVAFDLVPGLESAGLPVRHQVVYDAATATALPSDVVREIRAQVDTGVILMSPRSAKAFSGLMAEAGLAEAAPRLTYFCLSPKVAEALAGHGSGRVAVARSPTAEEMLALVKELSSNHP